MQGTLPSISSRLQLIKMNRWKQRNVKCFKTISPNASAYTVKKLISPHVAKVLWRNEEPRGGMQRIFMCVCCEFAAHCTWNSFEAHTNFKCLDWAISVSISISISFSISISVSFYTIDMQIYVYIFIYIRRTSYGKERSSIIIISYQMTHEKSCCAQQLGISCGCSCCCCLFLFLAPANCKQIEIIEGERNMNTTIAWIVQSNLYAQIKGGNQIRNRIS